MRHLVAVGVRERLGDFREDLDLLLGGEFARGECEVELFVFGQVGGEDQDSVAVVVLYQVSRRDDRFVAQRAQ